MYDRQRHASPASAPTLPVGWEPVLLTVLSPDPRQRPQPMHELMYPLAMLLPESAPHRSGFEILRGVARRWAEVSPADETLRGLAATSGACQAFTSVAWPGTPSWAWFITLSGSWPIVSSGVWLAGAWPSAMATLPASVAPMPIAPVEIAIGLPGDLPVGWRVPSAWKLALVAASLAWAVILAIVAVVHARGGL
ncbi:MAG TPA: hypothetical protein VFP84_06610 [Kofleriaceae bacterium]|nr:hypothetical protein [Kofleriaceae bacterium]